MSRKKHPWYDNWRRQRKQDHYPWPEDFEAYCRWALRAGYCPNAGDRVVQRTVVGTDGKGYVRVCVRRVGGAERPGAFMRAIAGDQKLVMDYKELAKAVKSFLSTAMSVSRPRVIFPREKVEELGLFAGLDPDEIESYLEYNSTAEDSDNNYEDQQLRNTWMRMYASCYQKNNTAYDTMGAHGVKVCPEWHFFEHFLKWAREHSPRTRSPWRPVYIIRKHKGDFSPENCYLA